jgi:hypothetical protein
MNGKEELTTLLLDFIELPFSHSAENMAEVLVKILKEYGIEEKVSDNNLETKLKLTYHRLSLSLAIMHQQVLQ